MNIKQTAVICSAIFLGLICHAEITKPETELERIAAEIRLADPGIAENRVQALAAAMREAEPGSRFAELRTLKQHGQNIVKFDGF